MPVLKLTRGQVCQLFGLEENTIKVWQAHSYRYWAKRSTGEARKWARYDLNHLVFIALIQELNWLGVNAKIASTLAPADDLEAMFWSEEDDTDQLSYAVIYKHHHGSPISSRFRTSEEPLDLELYTQRDFEKFKNRDFELELGSARISSFILIDLWKLFSRILAQLQMTNLIDQDQRSEIVRLMPAGKQTALL